MGFLMDNYVWFIVGGSIVFMALIGFIAEKTNFGRGEDKKTEPKPETIKPINENKKIMDAVIDNANPTLEFPLPIETTKADDIIAPSVPELPIEAPLPVESNEIENLTVEAPSVPELPIETPLPVESNGIENLTVEAPSVPELPIETPLPVESNKIENLTEEAPIAPFPEDNPVIFVKPVVLDAATYAGNTISPTSTIEMPQTFDSSLLEQPNNNLEEISSIENLPNGELQEETSPIENLPSEETQEEISSIENLPNGESQEEMSPIENLPSEETQEELTSNIAPAQIDDVINGNVESEDDIWNF